jgi:hypothetical protein
LTARNGTGEPPRTDYLPARPPAATIDLAKLAREIVRATPPERKALGLDEAATSLGVSVDYLKQHILPDLRIVRRGRRKLIPTTELDRWLDEAATYALPGPSK